MSPTNDPSTVTRRRRPAAGFTLPEVLLSVSLMAIIGTVLASAITITLRQSTDSEGRLNVARAEQSIDTWLPADLASTDVNDIDLPGVDLDPAADPCGDCSTVDVSGANALQLAWTTTEPGSPPTEVTTRVQYQYVQRGDEWVIERVRCTDGEPCSSITVLRDLAPPSDLGAYDPNTTSPTWVMDVSVPAPDASLELNQAARQIVVTVDGGGTGDGAFGGLNTISLTAGGGETSEIAADDFNVPSFVRANSRCGGLITLIVDDSGSIGSNVSVVEAGVAAFIDAFRGTPTELQLIRLEKKSSSIGSSDWHSTVDMTDEVAVNALETAMYAELDPTNGNTNWEDAFYRALKNEDGSSASNTPRRIVFFTDGVPTINRTTLAGGWSTDYHSGDPYVDFNAGNYDYNQWPTENGYSFHQESWDRADIILDQHRDIDLVFVGVGDGLTNSVSWIHDPAVYENPYAAPPTATTVTGADTLAYLLTNGARDEVTAQYDSTTEEYTNPETANFYLQSDFNATAFAAALSAVALKDCGGTVTIQTRLTDGSPVTDEFVYENVEYRDQSGTPIEADARRVTTSSIFRTGTFDFELAGASSFSVDVVPQELQTLDGYTPVGWTCRSAGVEKTLTDIPIEGSDFSGFTVDVTANEAVSCLLTVSN